ncbi:MAG: glycosyltransferase family 2 protein [Candidatus Hydrothermarchaeales archaeon]
MNTLLVIPVYQEEENISKVLYDIEESRANGIPFDILIIDDGSTDSTPVILDRLQKDITFDILMHRENAGYGNALKSGFDSAIQGGYDTIITMDADEQHDPDFLKSFFATKGADILSGSRYQDIVLGTNSMPPDRFLINMIMTTIVNHLTAYDLTDSFCGMKAYNVDALKKLDLTGLAEGYEMPLQLLFQARFNNLSIMEIPVPLIYKTHEVLAPAPKRLEAYINTVRDEVVRSKKQHIVELLEKALERRDGLVNIAVETHAMLEDIIGAQLPCPRYLRGGL